MQRYISRRLIQMIIALFLMSVIVFLLGRLSGDPVSMLLSQYSTEEDRVRITEQLGLTKPILEQYGIFIFNALKGDLGKSVAGDNRPALTLILERFPASLELALVALIISILIGIPLGVLSAVKRGSFLDASARLVALLGQSLPAFWLGIVLMYFFSVKLRLLPTSGYGGIQHFILPAATMGLFTVAAVTRLTRSSMLEVLDSEYIKLARIKGVSEVIVIWKHALRNSLMPVITFMGTFFATMITGAVVIETVFSWPGIGRLAYESILNRDFPVMQGVILFMTTLYILANLIVDVLYAWVDPRIRYTNE
jgi:peptide/nickel transport system permease protein